MTNIHNILTTINATHLQPSDICIDTQLRHLLNRFAHLRNIILTISPARGRNAFLQLFRHIPARDSDKSKLSHNLFTFKSIQLWQ